MEASQAWWMLAGLEDSNRARKTMRRAKTYPRVCRPRNGSLLIEDVSTLCREERPYQNRSPCHWYDSALGHEQPSQVVRMHIQEWDLNKPKQEEANHGIGRNTLRFGYVIW